MNLPDCKECREFYQKTRETLVRITNELAQAEKAQNTRKIEYGDRIILTREITRGDIINALIGEYHKSDHDIRSIIGGE
jgi:hypothetical protein